ncbi:translation initiation factor eIF-2B [Haloplanus rubicundus]|uniref:Translation initiation factor eIF-2B n=1 Tax=Haloplanus rubicundus TaxID=1547898 RepID=A0A345EFB7_9EURY|nr:translation initiation factor eIF-2B [Haloplanus rubicundus]AXG07474.1 translation initiation factor eIF-2B [Haloplanus rubicundus]AXG10889.1 translation initiation factor eIF-2B [Haloplanus rubicundus]
MIDETIEEIRRMQTHSSSVVAVKATTALEELLDRDYRNVEAYERDLERNAGALRRANPSHASLHKAMREVVDNVLGEVDSVEAAKSRTREEIDRIVEGIETGKHRAAARAATTFEDGETVLTHDFSTTVLEAVEVAAAEGCHLTAYVTEARPRYLGRKTARRLAEMDRVEPHLLVDSAAGHVLDRCDRVVVGMTCIVGETLYNRVGTFPLVAAASVADVPVTVVGSESKIIESDFVFENEEREPAEVIREPVEGVRIENPAYDATPMDLIDEVVTDQDQFAP